MAIQKSEKRGQKNIITISNVFLYCDLHRTSKFDFSIKISV
jgi:hypothetical protein